MPCVVAEDTAAGVLAALGRTLNARKVRWYVFGAQAVIHWGRPRLSADVDITVGTPVEEARGLAAALMEAEFDPLVEDVEGFVERTRVLPIRHRPSGLPVDVVFGGSALENEFLERAIEARIAGVRVPMIAPEDLIVTKLLAGRPKDIEDVRGILSIRGATLELDCIRSVLSRLESALDRSDLVRELDRLAH